MLVSEGKRRGADMHRIMIIDDERKIRKLFKTLLTEEDFEVLEAATWEEATMKLLQDKDIELFLLDIRMPEIDGAGLFQAIKLYNKNAKVIVTSVYSLQDQKRMISKADDYFDKSEGTDSLVRKVKMALAA